MSGLNDRQSNREIVRRFKNGITVAIEPLPYLRSASIGLWIHAGSCHEQPKENGIAHFLEHLFFKGTERRTAQQLVEIVEGKGGQLNAYTSREYTCLYAKTLDDHVDEAVDVLADILRHSTYCDLEKERNVVLEEIAAVRDVPEDYLYEVVAEQFWPNHALGRPIAGVEDTVSGITLDDVRQFYTRWYRPDNIIVAAAGNFDPDHLLETFERLFGDLQPGEAPESPSGAAPGHGAHALPAPLGQSHLCFAFSAPPLTEERRYVQELINSIIGASATSRLFDRIREREGLAYSVYSFYASHTIGGMFGLYAGVAAENVARCTEIIGEELRRLKQEPVTVDELEANRTQIKGGMFLSLESTFTRMARMAKNLMMRGRIVPLDETVAAFDAVTPDDIAELANETFKPDAYISTLLGADAQPQELVL